MNEMQEANAGSEEELEISNYEKEQNRVLLHTHERINVDLAGRIEKHEEGYIELSLETLPEMIVDDKELIHGGFIFSAADFAAMAAVNEKNVVLVASECQFLSPVKFGDVVDFTARVRHKEGRKRNVQVIGNVLDIKVFTGEFKTVVTDRHVLQLKLLDAGEGEE